MIFRDAGITILIIIVAVCAIGGFVSSKWLGDDNPVEEFSEDVIKMETGVSIDLTPSSPEKK